MKIPPIILLYILLKQINLWMGYRAPPQTKFGNGFPDFVGGGFITFITVDFDLEKFNFISVLVNKYSRQIKIYSSTDLDLKNNCSLVFSGAIDEI